LSNPAQPQFQVIGASTDGVLELMANALKELGTQRALVVHGTDQVDEISISAPTRVVELHAGEVRSYSVNPETFGVPAGEKSDLAGGDAAANARIIESILGGEKGVRRNVVLINAAAALLTSGAVGSLQEGVRMAAESVDSGRAADKLRQLQEASQ
jgi:anthranilate phosphoribosyltransferase